MSTDLTNAMKAASELLVRLELLEAVVDECDALKKRHVTQSIDLRSRVSEACFFHEACDRIGIPDGGLTIRMIAIEDQIRSLRDENAKLKAVADAARAARALNDLLGFWVSGALNDETVCDEMKADIGKWLDGQAALDAALAKLDSK